MNVFALMFGVTVCYTITSFSDKYAVSKAKFSGDEFTFLMCSSLSVFTLLSLPFQDIYFTLTWQSFAAILLIAVCKIFEFQMNAIVLRQLSAFELKAWIGVTLFVSYLTDVIYGAELSMLKLLCIAATVTGLALIVRSGRENKIEYRKIAVPLALYLAAKYGYGLIIKTFTPYVSPTMQFMPALMLVSLIMLTKINLVEIFKKNKKGAANVILARIPNTAGMLIENIVISVSLASYSFIQPMILISLFVIGIIQRNRYSRFNLAGSIICIAGVVIFQLV
ncbi:MAG: hypothetical protein K2J73_00350 [Oscillospiraceae bacterium]|nr:hypothetical protein [Oscillospiraceae bacterium]